MIEEKTRLSVLPNGSSMLNLPHIKPVSTQPADSVKALQHVVCQLKASHIIRVQYNAYGSGSFLSAAGRTVRNYSPVMSLFHFHTVLAINGA